MLVKVVLLEQSEPLQLGISLGQSQYSWIARGNRLDLGIAQFLAADVLGTAGGVVPGDDLTNKSGLRL